MNKISCLARGFRKSTEDLYRSTNLYKTWDQRQMIRHWRHAAWALLRDHGVVCAVWLDEVLAYHGAEFPLGDYCLVVDNPQVAAGILSLYGYQILDWTNDRTVLSCLNCERIKMRASSAMVDVVLLSASEWSYELSSDALHDDLCPYLPEFISSMIELWLRVPTRAYTANAYLMTFLTETIRECYKLNDFGDDVCTNDYAVWLKPHHHEVHFDIVARTKGLVKGHLDFQARHRHHVHKSNLIKQGRFSPRPRRRRSFRPQLPSLVEMPEDTRPACGPGSAIFSTNAIKLLPSCTEIGIAL